MFFEMKINESSRYILIFSSYYAKKKHMKEIFINWGTFPKLKGELMLIIIINLYEIVYYLSKVCERRDVYLFIIRIQWKSNRQIKKKHIQCIRWRL